jgi:hypothetical protein
VLIGLILWFTIGYEGFIMANITERVPDDTEIEAMTSPRNSKSGENLQHKRQVKRRLEDYLEQAQLRKAIGDDDFF